MSAAADNRFYREANPAGPDALRESQARELVLRAALEDCEREMRFGRGPYSRPIERRAAIDKAQAALTQPPSPVVRREVAEALAEALVKVWADADNYILNHGRSGCTPLGIEHLGDLARWFIATRGRIEAALEKWRAAK